MPYIAGLAAHECEDDASKLVGDRHGDKLEGLVSTNLFAHVLNTSLCALR